jgi:hypothetical protein
VHLNISLYCQQVSGRSTNIALYVNLRLCRDTLQYLSPLNEDVMNKLQFLTIIPVQKQHVFALLVASAATWRAEHDKCQN